MKYKEVHSIKSAEGKIKELQNRIKRAKQVIQFVKDDDLSKDLEKSLISTRNRRIGQLNRQIKHYKADMKSMEKINRLSTENIY